MQPTDFNFVDSFNYTICFMCPTYLSNEVVIKENKFWGVLFLQILLIRKTYYLYKAYTSNNIIYTVTLAMKLLSRNTLVGPDRIE